MDCWLFTEKRKVPPLGCGLGAGMSQARPQLVGLVLCVSEPLLSKQYDAFDKQWATVLTPYEDLRTVPSQTAVAQPEHAAAPTPYNAAVLQTKLCS